MGHDEIYDLIVLGAGPAGVAATERAARLGATAEQLGEGRNLTVLEKVGEARFVDPHTTTCEARSRTSMPPATSPAA